MLEAASIIAVAVISWVVMAVVVGKYDLLVVLSIKAAKPPLLIGERLRLYLGWPLIPYLTVAASYYVFSYFLLQR